MRAEVKVATMLVQNNVPLALADELTLLFHDIFPDSEIAPGADTGYLERGICARKVHAQNFWLRPKLPDHAPN